ncbi:hypothetical protein D3C77_474700 [compost metagenome]
MDLIMPYPNLTTGTNRWIMLNSRIPPPNAPPSAPAAAPLPLNPPNSELIIGRKDDTWASGLRERERER